MRLSSRALGLAALVAFPSAAEDLTIAYKVSSGDKTATATTYVGAAGYKHSEGDAESIFDFKTGKLSVVDNKKRQYWETTAEEMQAAMQKMSAQMTQMQEQMKNMPPALRDKMMAGMGAMAESVKATKGGAPRSVAGYSCQPWLITIGGDPESAPIKTETCNTKDIAFPAQAWEARKAMMGGMGGANPMGQNFQKLFDEMKKIEGFSVSETTTLRLLGKAQTTTREVTEVKKGAIPASAFAVPEGYKKVDSPYAKMAR
ncbi:MAG TPA: DUF4412 domain-containing protein [Vicinamibacteria bacterium]|nr:DUF4412 domain-containing protein [Vicinamibacteria bacterium]